MGSQMRSNSGSVGLTGVSGGGTLDGMFAEGPFLGPSAAGGPFWLGGCDNYNGDSESMTRTVLGTYNRASPKSIGPS